MRYDSGAGAQSERRNSQPQFAAKSQSIIVFDWDDTLFPTTWVRHYMGLHWKLPLEQQPIREMQRRKIKDALDELSDEVEALLNLALTRGHVSVVTLARQPWVDLSCENFFPRIGALLRRHRVTISYAQEGVVATLGRNKGDDVLFFQDKDDMGGPPAGPPEEIEKFWIRKKQNAIQREVEEFYSQYPGQSWKNVISVGDSEFERRATHDTMRAYQKPHPEMSYSRSAPGAPDRMCLSGCLNNHYRRLRMKTVKMYEAPRIKDLVLEIQLLKKWMPSLVALDSGLDVDLEDDDKLAETHRKLTGEIL